MVASPASPRKKKTDLEGTVTSGSLASTRRKSIAVADIDTANNTVNASPASPASAKRKSVVAADFEGTVNGGASLASTRRKSVVVTDAEASPASPAAPTPASPAPSPASPAPSSKKKSATAPDFEAGNATVNDLNSTAVAASPAKKKKSLADIEEGRITVAVRCRPFNARELKLKSGMCLTFAPNGQSLKIYEKGVPTPPDAPESKENKANPFAFDHAYGPQSTQAEIYEDIGKPVMLASFEGFNTCIFAYGQTGSGKSFAMMGPTGPGAKPELRGITPRLCADLFAEAASRTAEAQAKYDAAVAQGVEPSGRPPQIQFRVDVTYLEIYNESVKCLLNPKKDKLKVRQHPVTGVYVEDLTEVPVDGYEKVLDLVEAGNASRQVAATNMNDNSSRSHAIFSLVLTQKRTITSKDGTEMVSDVKAKINLVDLAGSERAKSTGALGDTLKEGAQINKSLSVLGQVISGLADLSMKKSKTPFIPYRDSMLTWLLKESLGGNSKTFMISALSPAVVNFEETMSTLRFADRAKSIVMRASVNENPYDKKIRELEEEVARLKAIIKEMGAAEGGAATRTSSACCATDPEPAAENKAQQQCCVMM